MSEQPFPLPRWTPFGVDDLSSDSVWQLAVFAPFPSDAHHAPYTRKPLARSIVANEPTAWPFVRKVGTAQSCRANQNIGRKGNRGKKWSDFCGTWSCEDCAVQRVVKILAVAHDIFRTHASIVVTVMPAHLFRRDAFRRAIERAHDVDDNQDPSPSRMAWGVRVERDGFVFAYSSSQLTRSFSRYSRIFDAIDAYEHLRTVALALPGIERSPDLVGFARGFRRKRTPSGVTLQAPKLTPSEQAPFNEHRDAIAHRDFGDTYEEVLDRDPIAADVISGEALRIIRPP